MTPVVDPFQVAIRIVERAGQRFAADAVMAEELRKSGNITRAESRQISQWVFGYYRWFGWLDAKEPIGAQMRHAQKLADAFAKRPQSFAAPDLQRAVPAWVGQHLEIGVNWLRALQHPAVLWLRAKEDRTATILKNWPDARPSALPNAIRYEGEQDLFRTPEFHQGWFELQDIASQAVGLICAPKPGETWWDACAGEGGKTLHFSELMGNRGLIWATDKADWRLRRLKLRAARAGCFNYRSRAWDGRAALPVRTPFDGVLLDAPCSGLGTWQRNPHARWSTTEKDIRELAALQSQLLHHAAPALKTGGRLLYAVCTLTREETTEVAARFTADHPGFAPLPIKNPLAPATAPSTMLWLRPEESGGNGMFVAAWTKR